MEMIFATTWWKHRLVALSMTKVVVLVNSFIGRATTKYVINFRNFRKFLFVGDSRENLKYILKPIIRTMPIHACALHSSRIFFLFITSKSCIINIRFTRNELKSVATVFFVSGVCVHIYSYVIMCAAFSVCKWMDNEVLTFAEPRIN